MAAESNAETMADCGSWWISWNKAAKCVKPEGCQNVHGHTIAVGSSNQSPSGLAQAWVDVAQEAVRQKADAQAEKELGNAAYKKKDFDAALEHYGKAIELFDGDISYLTNR